jgi:hypothetical protein
MGVGNMPTWGGLPRGGEDFCCRRDGFLRAGDIESSPVEHAAFRSKIIFHVHDNDRGSSRIDRDRFRFCIDRKDFTLRLSSQSLPGWETGLIADESDDSQSEYYTVHNCFTLGA